MSRGTSPELSKERGHPLSSSLRPRRGPTTPRRGRSVPTAEAQEIRQKRSARTETQEPILFPKLGIELADFPYLHCSRD
ncbi:hypothetical protein TNCT_90091 [Trichonephila clavata]|uniref:Uncharacterized protein n=1 Tax=Trichonephila clavata TaxID=2740835 RepID=A0A8X6IZW5_TRICU|nr:hypothetical protein TNCT_214661 [Trichonephila clavata]GFQ85720.1 hypothetical protein TNCT_273731 [Trichonephila clavata]GFR31549.1 hypothetical protein TNCT_90091 [Trichonephila clavata]